MFNEDPNQVTLSLKNEKNKFIFPINQAGPLFLYPPFFIVINYKNRCKLEHSKEHLHMLYLNLH